MSSLISFFKPVLQIYTSEFRRKIYLEEFIKYAYTSLPFEPDDYNYSLEFSNNLDHIFRTYCYELDKTDAVTIASFISYLGTNGGQCLLETFRKYGESSFFRDKEEAFLHAWYKENSRQFGINSNLRSIEYMLTPIEQHSLHSGLDKFSIDNIKQTQYEVIELLVKWLSTPSGITYLLTCEDLINQEKDKTHEVRKLVRQPEE